VCEPTKRERNGLTCIEQSSALCLGELGFREYRIGRVQVSSRTLEPVRPSIDFGEQEKGFAADRGIGPAAGNVVQNRRRTGNFARICEASGASQEPAGEVVVDFNRAGACRCMILRKEAVVSRTSRAMELARRKTEIRGNAVRIVPLKIDPHQNRRLPRTLPAPVRCILRLHGAQRSVYAPFDKP
jgi:hypothetical protein